MKKNLTELVFILDRSESMSGFESEINLEYKNPISPLVKSA